MDFVAMMHKRRHLSSGLIASALVVLGTAACGGGDDAAAGEDGAATEDLAMYQAGDRSAVLEAGAAEEGVLNLYTNPTTEITTALVEGFTAEYPDLTVQVTHGSSADLAQRIAEEASAGRDHFDLVETSSGVLDQLQEAGLTQPYYTPEATYYPEETRDSEGYYVTCREGVMGLGYNTDLISEADVPKTYEDLLDPRWEGQMSISGDTNASRFVGNLELKYGEEFLQKLADQHLNVQNISSSALADLVVSGEVPLSPTIYSSHAAENAANGAPIGWIPLEPVVSLPTGLSLSAESPNPHAALLFIDYALSEEGQEIYLDNSFLSAREGMSVPGQDYERIYLDTRDDYYDRLPVWEEMLNKYFISGH